MTYDKITALEILDAIRLRPGMYIGSTGTPTHLFHEVIDNSIDEAAEGHCHNIEVTINDDHFTVKDDGRGFPQRFNEELGMYDPVVAFMKPHSGGKFTGDSYKTSIGLHGIGLTAVNALSTRVHILTRRDGSLFEFEINSRKPSEPKITNVGRRKSGLDLPGNGTVITVYPDSDVFTTIKLEKREVVSRLRLARTFVPKLNIIFNGKEVKPYEDKELVSGTDTPVWHAKTELGGEEIQVWFGYDTKATNSRTTNGSVNLLEVNYGSHIRAVENIIKTAWFLNMNDDMKEYLEFDDYMMGIRCFTAVKVKSPSYTSQTKDTLAGSLRDFDHMKWDLVRKVQKILKSKNAAPYVKALLKKFKDHRQFKNKQSMSKYLDEVLKFGSSDDHGIDRSVKLESKLIDCSSQSREETELFIVEGDSAGGGLVPYRNSQTQAILPLRGKIKNAVDHDIKTILDNLEIRSLINAIGCGVLDKEAPDRIRYGKIIIATDADVDGLSIQALVVGILTYLVPQTVENGRLWVAKPPLFGQYDSRGNFYPVWDQNKLWKRRDTLRFKGLGSMNPDELAKAVLDDSTRVIDRVRLRNAKDVTNIVGNPAIRKRMLIERGVVRL